MRPDRETEAYTFLECNVECPYCEHYEDRLDDLGEWFDNDSLGTDDCDADLKCSKCRKIFTVKSIYY